MPAWKHWRPRRPTTPAPPAEDETPQQETPEDETPEETEHDHDQEQEDVEEEPLEDQRVPWYSVGPRTAPGPDPDGPQTWTVSPGVQITLAPPQQTAQPSPASLRRQRIRRWLARHAAAAGVGWLFGLYQSVDAFVNSIDRGGAAAGLALAGFGWWGAELVTDRLGRIPFVPQRTLPALHWLARVPFATALLVTAIHAPNAHL